MLILLREVSGEEQRDGIGGHKREVEYTKDVSVVPSPCKRCPGMTLSCRNYRPRAVDGDDVFHDGVGTSVHVVRHVRHERQEERQPLVNATSEALGDVAELLFDDLSSWTDGLEKVDRRMLLLLLHSSVSNIYIADMYRSRTRNAKK